MIAKHAVPLSECFNFNVRGITGTPKDKAFYRLKAICGGSTYVMGDTCWARSNTNEYYLKDSEDKTVFTDQYSYNQNSSILFQVAKFDTTANTWDETYAFCVLPLMETRDGKLVLIQGQF